MAAEFDARVEFCGRLPQQELWRLMASCDAFVLPSLKEGGGFAAFEAAALGLPVVAFDAGGPAARSASTTCSGSCLR